MPCVTLMRQQVFVQLPSAPPTVVNPGTCNLWLNQALICGQQGSVTCEVPRAGPTSNQVQHCRLARA